MKRRDEFALYALDRMLDRSPPGRPDEDDAPEFAAKVWAIADAMEAEALKRDEADRQKWHEKLRSEGRPTPIEMPTPPAP